MPDVSPSPSLLQRLQQLKESQPEMGILNKIFMTQDKDPRIGQSLDRLNKEMPEASHGIVTPMSRWEALTQGGARGAEGITGYGGTGMNAASLTQGAADERMIHPKTGLSENQYIDRSLAHELMHQRQLAQPGAALQSTMYNLSHSPMLRLGGAQEASQNNPLEIGAYQYENERAHKGKIYKQYKQNQDKK